MLCEPLFIRIPEHLFFLDHLLRAFLKFLYTIYSVLEMAKLVKNIFLHKFKLLNIQSEYFFAIITPSFAIKQI